MQEYADSIKEVGKIWNAKDDKNLIILERKMLNKLTGKVYWLTKGCRPNLSYNNKAKIKDLKDVSNVMKRVREIESKLVFEKKVINMLTDNRQIISSDSLIIW